MVMEKWVDARNVQEAESTDLAAGASSDTPEELGRSPPDRELGCLHLGQTTSRRESWASPWTSLGYVFSMAR